MFRIHEILLITVTVLINFVYVNSRIQLKPPEEIKVDRDSIGLPCSVDINKELVEPQPLFLQPGSTDFWPVDKRNVYLEIPHGSDVELHCTQGFRIEPRSKFINATCMEDKTFLVKEEKVPFYMLNCSSPAKYKIRDTNITCGEHAKIYEVGFNISVKRFVKTLDICHDKSSLTTLWTLNKLEPASVHFQKSVQRLNFSKVGFFEKRNMNYLYSKENQKTIFQNLLGNNYVKFFNNRTQFLARGHLSSKTDHIFGSQQRTTFHFLNAAPQWQIFNGGTWNAVENGIRKLVATKGLTVDCYTGTWGVLSLPNSKGEPREIYLSFDENNNGEIPVPKLFFKIIVDTKSRPKRGVVLIGVNNPYVTKDELDRDYLICDDVSESIPWIKWRRDNLSKGYFFACEVDDFTRVVEGLPKSLKSVTKLLV